MPSKSVSEANPTLDRRQLLSALRALRRGEFEVRMRDDLEGLDGQLCEVFNDLAQLAGALCADVSQLRVAVGSEGRTHRRLTRGGLRGGWAQVGIDINGLLDDMTTQSDEMARVVAAGGEGLMLHRRDARYRPGRSEHLLKYKPHQDAEAQVVAHLPGKGKYEGMMGALQVRTPEGRHFRLGTGFTDAQRAAPPPLGAWVTYRYSGLTSTGLPRFARFMRIRDDMPLPDHPP